VYNLKVQKLVRVIRSDNPKPEQPMPSMVIDFCFSGDVNTHMVVIWGPQDPILAVYKWYVGKIVATVDGTGCFRVAYAPDTDLIAAISATQLFLIVAATGSAQKTLVDIPSKVCSPCDVCTQPQVIT
jgi:hypothetical protein